MTENDHTPWTPSDQARADQFAYDILAVTRELATGVHVDAPIVGMVQAVGLLMQRQIAADPSRREFYAAIVRTLGKYVEIVDAPVPEWSGPRPH